MTHNLCSESKNTLFLCSESSSVLHCMSNKILISHPFNQSFNGLALTCLTHLTYHSTLLILLNPCQPYCCTHQKISTISGSLYCFPTAYKPPSLAYASVQAETSNQTTSPEILSATHCNANHSCSLPLIFSFLLYPRPETIFTLFSFSSECKLHDSMAFVCFFFFGLYILNF